MGVSTVPLVPSAVFWGVPDFADSENRKRIQAELCKNPDPTKTVPNPDPQPCVVYSSTRKRDKRFCQLKVILFCLFTLKRLL